LWKSTTETVDRTFADNESLCEYSLQFTKLNLCDRVKKRTVQEAEFVPQLDTHAHQRSVQKGKDDETSLSLQTAETDALPAENLADVMINHIDLKIPELELN